MSGVKLGYVALRTLDLDASVRFYDETWGLELASRSDALAYLRATDGLHHSLRLRQADERGIDEIGLLCADETELDRTVNNVLAQVGGDESRVGDVEIDPEPGIGRRVVVTDPADTRVSLYLPVDDAAAETARDDSHREVRPTRIGHVVLMTEDLDTSLAFYTDGLGFTVSDWLWPFAAFIRCNEIHHSLALFHGGRSGLQHVAWEVETFDDVMTGLGHMRRNGRPTVWGPGRHAVGENIFTYYKDPDDYVIEYFAEVELFNDESTVREPRKYEMGEFGDDAWRLAGAAPAEVRA